jgi:hypothetical protein
MVGWAQGCFHKKHAGTYYAELVFLHQVGCTDHVVHCGVSGAQNVIALFFMLGWESYGFDKKRVGAHYAELVFLHQVGCTSRVVHSGMPRA